MTIEEKKGIMRPKEKGLGFKEKGGRSKNVEWAGEYKLYSSLNERLKVLQSIENVALKYPESIIAS